MTACPSVSLVGRTRFELVTNGLKARSAMGVNVLQLVRSPSRPTRKASGLTTLIGFPPANAIT